MQLKSSHRWELIVVNEYNAIVGTGPVHQSVLGI